MPGDGFYAPVSASFAEDLRVLGAAKGPEGHIVPAPPVEPKARKRWLAHVFALKAAKRIDREQFQDAMVALHGLNATDKAWAERSKAVAERVKAGAMADEAALLREVEYGGAVVALYDRVRKQIRSSRRKPKALGDGSAA